MPSPSAVSKLRQLLANEGKVIVCAGVYDGLTARIDLDAGFDALYMVSMPSFWNTTELLLTGCMISRQGPEPQHRDLDNLNLVS